MNMSYKIVVTKLVENPNYEEERIRFEQDVRGRFQDYNPEARPKKMIEDRQLEITLTEEEFQEVKKGVLQVM